MVFTSFVVMCKILTVVVEFFYGRSLTLLPANSNSNFANSTFRDSLPLVLTRIAAPQAIAALRISARMKIDKLRT